MNTIKKLLLGLGIIMIPIFSYANNNSYSTEFHKQNIPYSEKLDIFLIKVKNMRGEINNEAKFENMLHQLSTQLNTLMSKYQGNQTISQMILYLNAGIEDIKKESYKNKEVDNFFCDFLETCNTNTVWPTSKNVTSPVVSEPRVPPSNDTKINTTVCDAWKKQVGTTCITDTKTINPQGNIIIWKWSCVLTDSNTTDVWYNGSKYTKLPPYHAMFSSGNTINECIESCDIGNYSRGEKGGNCFYEWKIIRNLPHGNIINISNTSSVIYNYNPDTCTSTIVDNYPLSSWVNGKVMVAIKTVSEITYEQEFKCNSWKWEKRWTEITKKITPPTSTSTSKLPWEKYVDSYADLSDAYNKNNYWFTKEQFWIEHYNKYGKNEWRVFPWN